MMRRLLALVCLVAVMSFGLASPALAEDEGYTSPPCNAANDGLIWKDPITGLRFECKV